MTDPSSEFGDIHWLMAILQNIDVGLVVLDRNYNIQLWNGFMESHSGISPQHAKDEKLFNLFSDIPEDWFRQKAEPVFQLKTRTFTIWEQRPYLFKFKNYRPITGRAPHMYQNTVMIPLESIDRSVNHICLIVYDVTDIAVNREDVDKANQTIYELEKTDLLSGLYSRTHWQPQLENEFHRCKRTNNPSCLVVFDVDNFKHINLEYGHPIGDAVLTNIGHHVQKTLRQTDSACRYSGEAFAILLVDTSIDAAVFFAERNRKGIAKQPINIGHHDIPLTISVGVSEFHPSFESIKDWEMAATKAMHKAKGKGKNCTETYTP